MVKEWVGSLAWLRKQIEQADTDLLREMLKTMAETLMSAEADANCGAPYHRPSADRVNLRNGYRVRQWDNTISVCENLDCRMPIFLLVSVNQRPFFILSLVQFTG